MADTAFHAAAHARSQAGSHSLRKRLLWFVLLAILLVAVLQAVTAYRSALRQADTMLDEHLQQVARSMHDSAPRGGPGDHEGDTADFELNVQIWGPDGRQLFRSRRSTLPPLAVLGFSDVEANGSRYRVYSLQTPSQTVQIAQDLSARASRAQALALKAVIPFALLTPLLMLAVWWVINRSLAPIERARRELALRAADDFSSLSGHDLPDEVRPLVSELNLLFGRVRDAFEVQQHFVADAAHELRSPLTALKLQAQALRSPNRDAASHDENIAQLNQGIDRAIHLVEQLLTLAREEASAGHPAVPEDRVDLQDIIKLAVSDTLAQAARKHIDLGLEGQVSAGAAQVAGQPEALRTMLRNLLDNAIKYTPDGGQVDVSLWLQPASSVSPASCRLTVEDSGPGIAGEDRARVFDRFFRASHVALTPGLSGSGLGLAIVDVIAKRHQASVALGASARLGGLQVDVVFPLASTPLTPKS